MTQALREQWLNNAVTSVRGIFHANGYPIPDHVRVSCGFPSKRARSLYKSIGEHWSSSASDDATHEILISPVVDDPVEVFAVLCHELAHSATDGDGHQGRFPRAARALSLEGKPSATVGGKEFRETFGGLIDGLGAYPHARLNVASKKTQGTRMIKASCPTCGYVVRLTGKWAAFGLPICPSDGDRFV
jgi:ribosomal protein L37E